MIEKGNMYCLPTKGTRDCKIVGGIPSTLDRRDRAQAASWSPPAISAAALGLARPHGMFGGGARLDKRLASVCIAVNIAALSGRPGEPTLVTCFGVCAMIVYQLCRWRWGWRHRTVGGASTEGSRHAPRVIIKVG